MVCNAGLTSGKAVHPRRSPTTRQTTGPWSPGCHSPPALSPSPAPPCCAGPPDDDSAALEPSHINRAVCKEVGAGAGVEAEAGAGVGAGVEAGAGAGVDYWAGLPPKH